MMNNRGTENFHQSTWGRVSRSYYSSQGAQCVHLLNEAWPQEQRFVEPRWSTAKTAHHTALDSRWERRERAPAGLLQPTGETHFPCLLSCSKAYHKLMAQQSCKLHSPWSAAVPGGLVQLEQQQQHLAHRASSLMLSPSPCQSNPRKLRTR